MIDFSNVKSIIIPEGEVATISRNGEILWQKQTKPYKQELAYIEGTGTQWIDTGVRIASFVPSIKIKFSSTVYSVAAYSGFYIGAMNGGSRGIGIKKSAADTVYVRDYQHNTSTAEVDSAAKWNEVFVNKVDGTITADGTTAELTGFNWYSANPVNFALFGTLNSKDGTIRSITKVSIAWCQFFDDSMDLIADLIPVLDFDDIPCMYDKVSGEFLYNKGSGNFLYGF